MAISQSTKVIAATLGALAVATVPVVFVFGGAGSSDVTVTPDARAAAADTFAADLTHTDLLSSPVAPGGDVKTGVTLPIGSHGNTVALTGSAVGAFIVTGVSETPTEDGAGVWLEVSAHNASASAVRFSADVAIGSASLSAAGSAIAEPPTPIGGQ